MLEGSYSEVTLLVIKKTRNLYGLVIIVDFFFT